MSRRTLWTRVALAAFYFAATFSILFYLYGDNSFFKGDNGLLKATIRFSIACTAWSFFASFCAAIVSQSFGGLLKFSAGFVSFFVAFAGFAYLPFWLYLGYGRFRFQNTYADMSYFFQGDAIIVFPIIVAPVLAALTLACEFVIQRTTEKAARQPS